MKRYTVIVLLSCFWIILSLKANAFFILMGGISVILSYVFSYYLLNLGVDHSKKQLSWLRIAIYLPWIVWQAVQSCVAIFKQIWGSKIVKSDFYLFHSKQSTEEGLFVLANSITFTPGTVSVDVVNGNNGFLLVHVLNYDDSAVAEMRNIDKEVYQCRKKS